MALNYDSYLFDFDGTLAETGEGIRRSVAYSLEKMGRPVPDRTVLDEFIGPPLHDCYVEYCGLSDEQAERAIEIYRERYVGIGLYESWLYPGIAMLLRALHRAGAHVAIVSAKPRFMLERLSAHFGIDRYLDAIVGTGLERHSADKSDLILEALPKGLPTARACMAGDRRFDMEAAKALGLHAIGADYGYSLPGELTAAGADEVYDSVNAMAAAMLGGDPPRGLLLSLEGRDECSLSVQRDMLKEYLLKRGFEVLLTREPGGCPDPGRIREAIDAALKYGKIVICYRYLDPDNADRPRDCEPGGNSVRPIDESADCGMIPDLTLQLEPGTEFCDCRAALEAILDGPSGPA